MPSSKHDRILSSVSHLNHLISFCVTNSVPFEYLEFAPTSLKDLTRISGSPALVWADIFLSNKKNLLQDIKKFTQGLKKFEKLIAGDKKRPLARLIEKINSKHNNLASQQ
jgi:prephenate dehydrogenase